MDQRQKKGESEDKPTDYIVESTQTESFPLKLKQKKKTKQLTKTTITTKKEEERNEIHMNEGQLQ